MDILHFGPQEYLKIPCDPFFCNACSSAIIKYGKDLLCINHYKQTLWGILQGFAVLSFSNFFSNLIKFCISGEPLFCVGEM